MKKRVLPPAIIAAFTIMIIGSLTGTAVFNAKAAPVTNTEWTLDITGQVENSLHLTLNDLVAMPSTTVEATIYCVDFPTLVVATGSWTGVKLSTLFEQAEVSSSAIKVAFYASDGYSTDLDLKTATSENVILAYAKDGSPLSETLRLVVPGKWGYKWISQVTSIELVDYDYLGKWESQGYSDAADVQLDTGQPGLQNIPASSEGRQPSQPSAPTAPATPSPSPQPSNTSTVQPSQETQPSKPENETQTSESFPTAWVAFAIVVIAVSLSLLAYIRKRRH